MGGQGSGRRPDPIKNLIGFNQPSGQQDNTLYLPNVSAIKPEAVKQGADIVTTEADPVFLALSGSIVIPHSQTSGQGVDDHHAQVHTIVSHDTSATGTELDTLTDNSMADTLHRHSELSASDGSPDATLSLNAVGNVLIDQNTDVTAFSIDSEATTQDAIDIGSVLTSGQVIDINLAPAAASTARGMTIDNNADCGGHMITLTNSGTGSGMFIDQNNDASAFRIENTGNIKEAAWIYSNQGVTATNPLVFLEADNAAFDQEVLQVQQDGVGNGLFIDQNGEGISLFIDSEAATQPSISVNSKSTSSEVVNIVADAIHTGTGVNSVFVINQANASSTGHVLNIDNEGTGHGLFIDQNGNGIGMEIDSEATSAAGLTIDMIDAHTGAGLYAGTGVAEYSELARDRASTYGTNVFYRGLNAAATAGPVVRIFDNHADDDQPSLRLDNIGDGPALLVAQSKDVEVIDFDGCTDGGTTHTTLSGSVKIQMPNGSTGYINVYT